MKDVGCRCRECITPAGMTFSQQSVIASVRPRKSYSSERANAFTCESRRRASPAKTDETRCRRSREPYEV
jgi:hypothetical protein